MFTAEIAHKNNLKIIEKIFFDHFSEYFLETDFMDLWGECAGMLAGSGQEHLCVVAIVLVYELFLKFGVSACLGFKLAIFFMTDNFE